MRFDVSRATSVVVDGKPVVGHVVVEVERWWDARAVGLLHFGCEVSELRFDITSADAEVLTRWTGVDNGGPVVRHMQYCVPGGPWRPIEEYNDDRLAAEAAKAKAGKGATP